MSVGWATSLTEPLIQFLLWSRLHYPAKNFTHKARSSPACVAPPTFESLLAIFPSTHSLGFPSREICPSYTTTAGRCDTGIDRAIILDMNAVAVGQQMQDQIHPFGRLIGYTFM